MNTQRHQMKQKQKQKPEAAGEHMGSALQPSNIRRTSLLSRTCLRGGTLFDFLVCVFAFQTGSLVVHRTLCI